MNEIESLKQELEKTQLALQMMGQLLQYKTGFLARTSHELRSPLSGLIGLHQLILSDLCDSPEEEREFMNQSYQYALKMMKLIDEIVGVSKIEYGIISLTTEPVQLKQILAEVYQLTYLQAANRSIRLNIIEVDPQWYVMADHKRLQQVLMMLIDSTISHSQEGEITVTIQEYSATNLMLIEINIPCPATLWNESVDTLQSIPEVTPAAMKSLSKTLELSLAMKLNLAQTLLETMQGYLKIVDLSTPNKTITQLQCWLPIASAEIVAQMTHD
jgi:signal transduction histidine kinase